MIALYASPVAVSSVVMVQNLGGDEEVAGQLVVWTTLFSSVTIFGSDHGTSHDSWDTYKKKEKSMQNEFTREKSLNLWSGMSLLAGIMIGSGIFFLGGQILGRIGNSLPLSLLAWFVGGIVTLFSGLSYAELGSLFPENGGYYLYLKEAYGKKVAFLSGTMNLVLASSGSIALLAVLFSHCHC
jgi:amino acid permease